MRSTVEASTSAPMRAPRARSHAGVSEARVEREQPGAGLVQHPDDRPRLPCTPAVDRGWCPVRPSLEEPDQHPDQRGQHGQAHHDGDREPQQRVRALPQGPGGAQRRPHRRKAREDREHRQRRDQDGHRGIRPQPPGRFSGTHVVPWTASPARSCAPGPRPRTHRRARGRRRPTRARARRGRRSRRQGRACSGADASALPHGHGPQVQDVPVQPVAAEVDLRLDGALVPEGEHPRHGGGTACRSTCLPTRRRGRGRRGASRARRRCWRRPPRRPAARPPRGAGGPARRGGTPRADAAQQEPGPQHRDRHPAERRDQHQPPGRDRPPGGRRHPVHAQQARRGRCCRLPPR